MKKYKDLNLKVIMDKHNLDFARYTFGKGQCSCCYGPWDMPAKYWRNGKIIPQYDEKNKKYPIRYILFKNAYNGSGTVKTEDTIRNYTCIQWTEDTISLEEIKEICESLKEQLDEDYFVEVPKDGSTCIIIKTKKENN